MRVGRLGGETDERVLLAAALTVRALRQGSVCVELDRLPTSSPTRRRGQPEDDAVGCRMPWPDADDVSLRCAPAPW